MQSANNVPEGCGSIQAEIYFSEKYRPLRVSLDELIEPVVRDLKRCELLHEENGIIFKNTYGYAVCEYYF